MLSELRRIALERARALAVPVYEDEMVKVVAGIDDDQADQLVSLILELSPRPLTWRELIIIFDSILGEGRLRRSLTRLITRGRVIRLPGHRFTVSLQSS